MHIRLTHKYAQMINGLDLRPLRVGEVIELEDSFATMLLREGWGERVECDPPRPGSRVSPRTPRLLSA